MTSAALAPLLWLLLVLALIPLVLLLLKRSGLANRLAGRFGRAAGAAPMLVLRESLALGPNQRVVAVEVGGGAQRYCLLLGVTGQQITPLQTLTLQVGADGASQAASFATSLAAAGRRGAAPAGAVGGAP
ncbi:MAG: hypothetical protein RIQ60_442 [Pseudomonadota bacterium]|jgi:flagellar protein FliO/FliZ